LAIDRLADCPIGDKLLPNCHYRQASPCCTW